MENSSDQASPSQLLITFKGPKSTDFEIKLSNLSASQMLLAAYWIKFRAQEFIAANEKLKRSQVARPSLSGPQILVPGLANLRGD